MNEEKQFEENEYYNEILQCYSSEDKDEKEKEIWKNTKLIELMNMLKDKEFQERNKENKLVQNSIYLLLALFDDLSPDYCSKIGKDSELIPEKEKRELKNTLLYEISD